MIFFALVTLFAPVTFFVLVNFFALVTLVLGDLTVTMTKQRHLDVLATNPLYKPLKSIDIYIDMYRFMLVVSWLALFRTNTGSGHSADQ